MRMLIDELHRYAPGAGDRPGEHIHIEQVTQIDHVHIPVFL